MVIFQKRVPGITELALGRFLARARHEAKIKGAVNVLLTSSAQMKSFNRRFRGKDKPTDVLSFPAIEEVRARGNTPSQSAVNLIGEIAISSDIACKNARSLGHSPAEEVKILMLHGLLHLAGHDHERDSGQMAKREEALRAQFGLPAGLIERASDGHSATKVSKKSAKSRKRPR